MFLRAARAVAAGLLVAMATAGTAAPVPADRVKADRQLATTAAKLHGQWLGGPCEGQITFRANGTYEWTGRGPGGDRDSGVWALRGDPASPALVLVCRHSDDGERIGKTFEYGLASVDGESLSLKHPGDEKPRSYEWADKDKTRY